MAYSGDWNLTVQSLLDIDDKLYRIYDDLSQSPYREGQGIMARAPPHQVHLRHAFVMMKYDKAEEGAQASRDLIRASVLEHLDWKARTASPYISLWDSWEVAIKLAEARVNKPAVYDEVTKQTKNRGDIYVATISLRRLAEAQGVFVNAEKALHQLGVVKTSARTYNVSATPPTTSQEWLAVQSIPDCAVTMLTKLRSPGFQVPQKAAESLTTTQGGTTRQDMEEPLEALGRIPSSSAARLSTLPGVHGQYLFNPPRCAHLLQSMLRHQYLTTRTEPPEATILSVLPPRLTKTDIYRIFVWHRIFAAAPPGAKYQPLEILDKFISALANDRVLELWEKFDGEAFWAIRRLTAEYLE